MTKLKSAAEALAEMDARIESKAAQRTQAMQAYRYRDEEMNRLEKFVASWMDRMFCRSPVGPVEVSVLRELFVSCPSGFDHIDLSGFHKVLNRRGSVDRMWAKTQSGDLKSIMIFTPACDWTIVRHGNESMLDYSLRAAAEIRQWVDDALTEAAESAN